MPDEEPSPAPGAAMANNDCRHQPTFHDFVCRLDSLLDAPDDLASYLDALDRRPGCRSLLTNLDEALDRLGHDAPLVAEEVRHSEAIYRELIQLEPETRYVAVESEEGILFRSWGVVILLIDHAREAKALEAARELAELGLFIAQRLDSDLYLPIYLADLQSRALAVLALVELRADRPDDARARLDLAHAMARLGLGEDLPEIARAEAELLDDVEARHEPQPPASREGGIGRRLLARLLRYAQHSRQDP